MDCLHSETRPCRYIKTNNAIVVVKQCLTCGRNLGELPKAAHDLAKIPDWDVELQTNWEFKAHEEWQRKRDAELNQQAKKQGEWWDGYNEYLNSDHWRKVREAVLKRDFMCQICFVKKSSQAHHLTYSSFNKWGISFPIECVGLCFSCHLRVHNDGGGHGH